jgi:predicted transcriptional regulator
VSNRLRICALLDAVEQAEFSLVQERLGFSSSVLSKHVSVLADAG